MYTQYKLFTSYESIIVGIVVILFQIFWGWSFHVTMWDLKTSVRAAGEGKWLSFFCAYRSCCECFQWQAIFLQLILQAYCFIFLFFECILCIILYYIVNIYTPCLRSQFYNVMFYIYLFSTMCCFIFIFFPFFGWHCSSFFGQSQTKSLNLMRQIMLLDLI